MVETKVGELLDGPTQASSPWLTIAEAADYLHTSERTIERMVARDRVRSTTVAVRARCATRAEQRKTPLSGAFQRADDGTRTHDLLHGKQTL